MEQNTLFALSAISAVINYGHSVNSRVVRRLRNNDKLDKLSTAVGIAAADLAETQDHFEMFFEEAEGYYERYKTMTLEQVKEGHPLVWKAWTSGASRRFSDALTIQKGASNPSGIARSLVDACAECLDEGVQQSTDPAVRLIVHQLAHLCNTDAFNAGLREYVEAQLACEAKVEAMKAQG